MIFSNFILSHLLVPDPFSLSELPAASYFSGLKDDAVIVHAELDTRAFSTSFPPVPYEIHKASVPGTAGDFKKKLGDHGYVMTNRVKICPNCKRQCGVVMKICNGCSADIERVEVTHADNVMSTMLFGVEKFGEKILRQACRCDLKIPRCSCSMMPVTFLRAIS